MTFKPIQIWYYSSLVASWEQISRLRENLLPGNYEGLSLIHIYLSGRTEIDTIGGLEQTVPVHATVKIFGFPSLSATETMTAGSG